MKSYHCFDKKQGSFNYFLELMRQLNEISISNKNLWSITLRDLLKFKRIIMQNTTEESEYLLFKRVCENYEYAYYVYTEYSKKHKIPPTMKNLDYLIRKYVLKEIVDAMI